MFINRLEVYYTMVIGKNTTYLGHTHYITTVMLKCIKMQIYKNKR